MQTQILLQRPGSKKQTSATPESTVFTETCRILFSANLCTKLCAECKIAESIIRQSTINQESEKK